MNARVAFVVDKGDLEVVAKTIEGLLDIASIAMPDSFYASDSRIAAGKDTLDRINAILMATP